MSGQKVTDEDNSSLHYISRLIFNYTGNELHISTILSLILVPIFILFCRYCIRSVINLCSSEGIRYLPHQQPIEVVEYSNPFTFHLHHSSADDRGIKCTIASETDCFVVSLWNVPIYSLFKHLHETTLSNMQEFIRNFATQSSWRNSNDTFFLPGGEELCKEFQIPDEFDFAAIQAPCPRLHYPFVLIMLSKDVSTTAVSHIVLLANIIHIPDQILTLPTQLYQQYVKSSNGYLGIIKKIYPSSFDSSHAENSTFELCVVCMSKEITVVVVPCGHACLCSLCFEQCKNCPICRGPVHYYFKSSSVSHS